MTAAEMQERGRQHQARYLSLLKAKGLVFRPMTGDEYAVYMTGAHMPQFSHIANDGDTLVVCEARRVDASAS